MTIIDKTKPVALCSDHAGFETKQAVIAYLKAEGIDNAYTYTNNKVVRVVYGRYDTEQQAHKELRVVRGNKHFEQAWIYKMTH